MKTPEGRPPAFAYHKGALHCERLPVSDVVRKYGTPLYLYSLNTIISRCRAFDAAFRGTLHTICYSVKANSNLTLLKELARLGCGFDVVSGGELLRVMRAAPRAVRNVVFSGVGKTPEEIDAALRAGILMFNAESESEVEQLAGRAARLKKKARLALRVNPNVPAETHPYIATGLHKHKFGIPIGAARLIYANAARQKWLEIGGVSVHIGSQITSVEPFGLAMQRVAELVRELMSDGHSIRYVDAGGGLGIRYDESPLPDFRAHAKSYATLVTRALQRLGVHLLLEPGRFIAGPAGALIVRVLYRKTNNGKLFAVVDGAMNDLIRPALYGAYHEIVPVVARNGPSTVADVVGPICETGDFFARDRELPPVEEGDLLAILDAGAYGFSLSSNYNTRPRAAEVMVDDRRARLVRNRESLEELLRNEKL